MLGFHKVCHGLSLRVGSDKLYPWLDQCREIAMMIGCFDNEDHTTRIMRMGVYGIMIS